MSQRLVGSGRGREEGKDRRKKDGGKREWEREIRGERESGGSRDGERSTREQKGGRRVNGGDRTGIQRNKYSFPSLLPASTVRTWFDGTTVYPWTGPAPIHCPPTPPPDSQPLMTPSPLQTWGQSRLPIQPQRCHLLPPAHTSVNSSPPEILF